MFRGSFVSSNFVAKLRTESKELRSSDITSTCERGLRTMRGEVVRAYKKELRLHNRPALEQDRLLYNERRCGKSSVYRVRRTSVPTSTINRRSGFIITSKRDSVKRGGRWLELHMLKNKESSFAFIAKLESVYQE